MIFQHVLHFAVGSRHVPVIDGVPVLIAGDSSSSLLLGGCAWNIIHDGTWHVIVEEVTVITANTVFSRCHRPVNKDPV